MRSIWWSAFAVCLSAASLQAEAPQSIDALVDAINAESDAQDWSASYPFWYFEEGAGAGMVVTRIETKIAVDDGRLVMTLIDEMRPIESASAKTPKGDFDRYVTVMRMPIAEIGVLQPAEEVPFYRKGAPGEPYERVAGQAKQLPTVPVIHLSTDLGCKPEGAACVEQETTAFNMQTGATERIPEQNGTRIGFIAPTREDSDRMRDLFVALLAALAQR